MQFDPTHSIVPDVLSPLARQALAARVHLAYTQLVVEEDGDDEMADALELLSPATVLAVPLKSETDARALVAGLWLWHDHLERCHEIVQALDSAAGSFWHAILHRRQGEFSNAKHWYDRCAGHPVMAALAANAQGLLNSYPADKFIFRLTADGWNAPAFVDLVSRVHAQPADPRHKLAVAIQQLEWRLLFDHCTRLAVE